MLSARHTPPGWRRRWLLRAGLLASVLTTALLAGATGAAGWVAVRFVAGAASGLVFVLGSAMVLEALPGALPFGGTSMGIVTMTMEAARRRWRSRRGVA